MVQWRNSQKNRGLYPLMNPVFRDPMRFPVASDAAISAQNMAKALETLTEQKVS